MVTPLHPYSAAHVRLWHARKITQEAAIGARERNMGAIGGAGEMRKYARREGRDSHPEYSLRPKKNDILDSKFVPKRMTFYLIWHVCMCM
jgi:hypothetical protein